MISSDIDNLRFKFYIISALKKEVFVAVPKNITNAVELERSKIQPGSPVHIGIVGPGQSTNDAIFAGRLFGAKSDCNPNEVVGVILSVRGYVQPFPWSDLVEFWPLPQSHCLSDPQKAGLIS